MEDKDHEAVKDVGTKFEYSKSKQQSNLKDFKKNSPTFTSRRVINYSEKANDLYLDE